LNFGGFFYLGFEFDCTTSVFEVINMWIFGVLGFIEVVGFD
jgi:hypothetical protein